MHVKKMDFYPDSESQRVLASVPDSDKNGFINAAIQAFAAGKSSLQSTSALGEGLAPDSSPAAVDTSGFSSAQTPIRAELWRLFGNESVILVNEAGDSGSSVEFINTVSSSSAQVDRLDGLSILKSLRQPITAMEVWEILEAIKSA